MSNLRISAVLLTLAMNVSIASGAITAPEALRCEHLERPLGVNTLTPRFSWKNTGGDVVRQSAYEILVGTDSASVAGKNKADLWMSGRVMSSNSTGVTYAGRNLAPRTQAWWKVRVWNENGKRSEWSEVSRFGVGITSGNPEPMRGLYIGMDSADGDCRSPILRHNLKVSGKSGRIMAHINSLGYHELYVNGHKAGTNVLSPGVSQLDRHSLIVTYDITDLVEEGDNDVVIHLGQGWYKPTTNKARHDGPLVKAEIDCVDGLESRVLLVSDGSWLAAESGRHDTDTWNALRFGGEMVDGRIAPADMSAASLSSLRWSPAASFAIASTATPAMGGENSIAESGHAATVRRLPDGSYLADMGRVLTGWFSMSPSGQAPGSEIIIEYSDNLTASGDFDAQGESDIYIASGKDGEKFCNKFHHHAYRYVRVNGLAKAPAVDDMMYHRIQGEYDDASTFKCSDADLNAVHDMIKYTMKCLTFSGYMVDCPHLERTGYGGDGNSSTMTLQTMYDVAPTYANWLEAWADVMDADGSLPHVAPAGGGGGGPYWCSFIVLAPWRTWLNYDDKMMLDTYYPIMKKWMDYVDSHMSEGLLRRWPDTHNRCWYLGDWLAPAGVDAGNGESVDLVNNCCISECMSRMSHIAGMLGLDEDAAYWKSRHDALNAVIHATYYNRESHEYATGSQLDMCYPMIVGATPQSERQAVRERMLQLSHERWNDHIGAGLVGVPIVTQWAIEEHQPDFMATMLRQHDYPGYLYMIDNGATATWEYWSGERSRVHNCYNGVGLWFYQGLGGIVPDESAPGYSHFFIDPQMAAGVDWAHVTKETPYGSISVKWTRDDAGVTYDVIVPSGTTAIVRTPAGMISATGQDTDAELSPGQHTLRYKRR